MNEQLGNLLRILASTKKRYNDTAIQRYNGAGAGAGAGAGGGTMHNLCKSLFSRGGGRTLLFSYRTFSMREI